MENKNFLLPEKVGNEILNYLASRPYFEVFKIIKQLEALQIVKDNKEEESTSS